MFRLMKKLDDAWVVRHLLDATDGPQFLIIWRNRHAFLIRVASTSQELADTALSPSFFPDEKTFRLEDLEDANRFGFEESDLPVCRMVVFPNVDNATIDQIERLRANESGVSFLGLKQTPADRFASHLEARAEPPLSPLMMLELRKRFDDCSRIRTNLPGRMEPLLRRCESEPLPPHFLDLDQETLAKLDVALAPEYSRLSNRFDIRLITGPAGCGKSLVLLHRAIFAARLNRRARLLVLTHNRPINNELRKRATATAGEGTRIECTTFFKWAGKYLPGRERVLSNHETVRRMQSLAHPRSSQISAGFLAEEIGYIRDLGVASLEEYLALERTGRLMALTPPRRAAVWKMLEAYRDSLRRNHETDWHEKALRFRDMAGEQPELLRSYDFIFIDEAQFFAKIWFEPVLAALRPGGQIFLAADPTQGFLKRNDSWIAAGIEVRGRSSRLSKPYRSTRAILRFARDFIHRRARLHPEAAGGIDPPSDEDLATIPEEGEAPVLLTSASKQDAITQAVREISAMRERSPHLAGSVLVLHADSFATAGLVRTLRSRLGADQVADLNSHKFREAEPFCSVCNVMAATGLEAAVVFLLGVDGLLESESDPRLDSSAHAELAADNTKLLYMAFTRAARRLVIFSNRWP